MDRWCYDEKQKALFLQWSSDWSIGENSETEKLVERNVCFHFVGNVISVYRFSCVPVLCYYVDGWT